MPKLLLSAKLLLLLSCFTATTYGQAPPVQWKRCYGGSNNDMAGAIRQVPGGGFVMCGRSTSSDSDLTANKGVDDAWITRVDAAGAITWQQNYGGSLYDEAEDIMPTRDGGYVFVGYASSKNGDVSGVHGNGTTSDIWVVKISNAGVLQWQKCIGGSDNDGGTSIQQTADSGYILTGYVRSGNGDVTGYHGNGDALVVKLDKTGSILWTNCIGGSESDDLTAVIQTADGGYILTGSTTSIDGDLAGVRPPTNPRDLWVVKLDAAGAISWQSFFGGTVDQIGYRILQTADGGYVVAGISASKDGTATNNYGRFDCWVLRISATGVLQWQKSYGGSDDDYLADIIPGHNGGYVFCGYTKSTDHDVTANKGNNDVWVVRVNDNGQIMWQQTYGGMYGEFGKSLARSADGGYAVLSTTNSRDGDVTDHRGLTDYWLIKLGQDPTGVKGITGGKVATVFPTVTDRMVYVTVPSLSAKSLRDIRVVNMGGAAVAAFRTGDGAKSANIDLNGFPTGNYLLQMVFSDGSRETHRILYGK